MTTATILRTFVVPADNRTLTVNTLMQTNTFIKDPSAVLDYATDWSAWLAASETITGAPTVTVPTGIVLQSGAVVTGGLVVFFLSGGTAGAQYTVSVTIATSQGRTDTRHLTIIVNPR